MSNKRDCLPRDAFYSQALRSLPRCLLVTLTCVAATGCGTGKNCFYKLTEKNGNATLTFTEMNDDESLGVDKVTIIFDGVTYTNISSGTATVSGKYMSTAGATGTGARTFTTSYADGVNTMTFSGHTFKLIEGGTKLEFGTQTIDLTGEKKTIIVKKDGAVEIAEDPQAEGE